MLTGVVQIPAATRRFVWTVTASTGLTAEAFNVSDALLETETATFGNLTPGAGWSGATNQPAQIGSGIASEEMAISTWDVVPYQTYAGAFTFPLEACHFNDMAYVSVSVDNGPWIRGTYEADPSVDGLKRWMFRGHARDFADGLHKARSLAVPIEGVPRINQTDDDTPGGCLNFNTNYNGTLTTNTKHVGPAGNDSTGTGALGNPFLTIRAALLAIGNADGHTNGTNIRLLDGFSGGVPSRESSEPAMTNTTRYCLIESHSGDASQVTITGTIPNAATNSDGATIKLLALHNVTQTELVRGSAVLHNASTSTCIWHHNVAFVGPGRTAGSSFRDTQATHRWITADEPGGTTVDDMQDAPDSMYILRNAVFTDLGQSGVHNVQVAVNVVVNPIDTTGVPGDPHPDADQFTQNKPNAIHHGVQTIGCPFSIRLQYGPGETEVSDAAFIDCDYNTTLSAAVWEMERPYRHIVFQWTRFSGAPFTQGGTFAATNMRFEDCVFDGIDPPAAAAGLRVD